MTREIETKYIVENFRNTFDVTYTIYVTYDDDLETIDVRVVRDEFDVTYEMEIGSDDDAYVFDDIDNVQPSITFPII